MTRTHALCTWMLGTLASCRRVQPSTYPPGVDPVIQSQGSDSEPEMTIKRQNVTIYHDQTAAFDFAPGQLHKEYIIETVNKDSGRPCIEPLFVRRDEDAMCGTGLFTTRTITCDPVPPGDVGEEIARLDGLEPPSARGFGVEFEFVARELTREMKDSIQPEHDVIFMGELIVTERQIPDPAKIPAIEGCFNSSMFGPAAAGGCSTHSHCALTDYCRADGVCDSRLNCQDASDAREGLCPVPLAHWNWEWDSSVKPLTRLEAKSVGASTQETYGVAFEVTSPGPPHVLSGVAGFRSVLETLKLLRHVGIQAGPSQGMHVHVNVMNDDVPGAKLSQAQVAAVWVAYAKFQLVIDEMLSPGRPGNAYAKRLFMGNCHAKDDTDGIDCMKSSCACVRRMFYQLHDWVHVARNGTNLEFCNAVLAMPSSLTPCSESYRFQRYLQLNLVPLHKYGTIEFRAHSATYDPARVARWVQFVVSFVEYYGNGPGFEKMQVFFAGESPDADYAALQKAQQGATTAELFGDLHGLVDAGAAEYFGTRAWEEGDPTCKPGGFKLAAGATKCGQQQKEQKASHWWDEMLWNMASWISLNGTVRDARH